MYVLADFVAHRHVCAETVCVCMCLRWMGLYIYIYYSATCFFQLIRYHTQLSSTFIIWILLFISLPLKWRTLFRYLWNKYQGTSGSGKRRIFKSDPTSGSRACYNYLFLWKNRTGPCLNSFKKHKLIGFALSVLLDDKQWDRESNKPWGVRSILL